MASARLCKYKQLTAYMVVKLFMAENAGIRIAAPIINIVLFDNRLSFVVEFVSDMLTLPNIPVSLFDNRLSFVVEFVSVLSSS